MPAQPLLAAGSLRNEVLAVVDQQLDLPVDALVRPRPREAGLPERGAGNRERVDRVGLSAPAAGTPLRHRQLRRHPHQLLATLEQLPFEPARQLAAVLEGPQPFRV